MASGQERRRFARSQQTRGNVSHDAQQRVDERVIEIMSRLDTAVRRDPPSDQAGVAAPRHKPQLAAAAQPSFLDSRAELGRDDLAVGREIRAPSGRECGDQAETTAGRRRRGSVAHRAHVLALVTHEMGTVEVAAANRKRASAHPIR